MRDNALRFLALLKVEVLLTTRSLRFWILCGLSLFLLASLLIGETVMGGLFRNETALLSGGGFVLPLFKWFNLAVSLSMVFITVGLTGRERAVRVEGILHSRPHPSLSALIGKWLGCSLPVILLCLAVCLLAVALNLIRYGDNYLEPICLSFLLTSLPAILLPSALVLGLEHLTGSKAISSLIPVGIILAAFFFTDHESIRFLDFAGFNRRELYSRMTGFGNIDTEWTKMLVFLFFSFSLLLFSLRGFPRLPDSTEAKVRRSVAWPLLALASALVLFFPARDLHLAQKGERDLRARERMAKNNFPLPSSYHLEIEAGTGREPYVLRAEMVVENKTGRPAGRLAFILNRGLRIEKIADGEGGDLPHSRELSLLEIDLPKPLAAGEKTGIVVHASGRLEPLPPEPFPPTGENTSLSYRETLKFFGSRKDLALDEFLLLVPESGWYPLVPSSRLYGTARGFATFSIELKTPPHLTAVTSGKLIKVSEGEKEREFLFESGVPLPQAALIIGEYEKVTGKIGDSPVHLYYAPGHGENLDYFRDIYPAIAEKIEERYEDAKEDLGLAYPYPVFHVIEVPAPIRGRFDLGDPHDVRLQPMIYMIRETDFFLAHIDRYKPFDSTFGEEEDPRRESKEGQFDGLMRQCHFTSFLFHHPTLSLCRYRLEPRGPASLLLRDVLQGFLYRHYLNKSHA